MLSDVQHVSVMRRGFITPKVNEMLKDITEQSLVDNVLFGEELSTGMKAAKDVKKTSNE